MPPVPGDRPAVSVVVPSYRTAALPRCLDHLLALDAEPTFEVVVVVSADTEAELPGDLPTDPRLRVDRHAAHRSAAAARNRGVALATGDLVAFTDADVLVPPDWLARLVEASDGGTRVVAGSVRNGTPDSNAGTAEYLVEFLDLHPDRPSRTAWHGATCNLLVPHAVLDRYGPFPEDMGGGEDTLLTTRAREEGIFTFAGSAPVTHLNRTDRAAVVRHQEEFGRFTAHLGRRGSGYKLQVLVARTALAPVAAVGRVVSIYARAFAWGRDIPLRRRLLAFPTVVLSMAAWGRGLFTEGRALDRAARSATTASSASRTGSRT